MSVSDDFLAYVVDQLSGWGDVTTRKMFGGAGLYRDGVMFGLIADDVTYLKVDDSNRADFEATGSHAFQPYNDKATTMPYYDVPADVLEDREQLGQWAEKALAIQLRKRRRN